MSFSLMHCPALPGHWPGQFICACAWHRVSWHRTCMRLSSTCLPCACSSLAWSRPFLCLPCLRPLRAMSLYVRTLCASVRVLPTPTNVQPLSLHCSVRGHSRPAMCLGVACPRLARPCDCASSLCLCPCAVILSGACAPPCHCH